MEGVCKIKKILNQVGELMSVLQNAYKNILLFTFICAPFCIFGNIYQDAMINQNIMREDNFADKALRSKRCKHKKLSYYLYAEDFIKSFIEIPASNVSSDSSTISSKYLAGRAAVYNELNEKVGTCTASFLCIQNEDGIYTDISNFLSVDNGLVVSWFTPTTLINLELDSIIHSMVTECIVLASTKIGFNPFYGEKFNMIVSSDDEKIYFNLKAL